MTILSTEAGQEIQALARSETVKQDFEAIAISRQNPFVKHGHINVDAYIAFVTEFNSFINHQPKPFKPIIDKDMRL